MLAHAAMVLFAMYWLVKDEPLEFIILDSIVCVYLVGWNMMQSFDTLRTRIYALQTGIPEVLMNPIVDVLGLVMSGFVLITAVQ